MTLMKPWVPSINAMWPGYSNRWKRVLVGMWLTPLPWVVLTLIVILVVVL